MNAFSRLGCRLFQGVMRLASRFLLIPSPLVLEDPAALSALLKEKGFSRLLLVTDKGCASLPSFHRFETFLRESFDVMVYDGAIPNPDFACVEAGAKAYHEHQAEALLAFGGGSPMDAAKAIGVQIAYPSSSLLSFKGLLKVHRDIPFLACVPTTVGTGSEATIAAVVVDEKNKDKFAIESPRLVPDVALLSPTFVLGLPPRLIASTGLDALTHALESIVGRSSTKKSKADALSAISRIFTFLPRLYTNPMDEEAAREMQKAAFEAGESFTRAYVGYVHALAHALGGEKGIPHGYANAVLLPHVLRAYGKSAVKPLSLVAKTLEMPGSTKEELAESFLVALEKLERDLAIPERFEFGLSEEEISHLAKHAAKEANPLYPVPKLFDEKELSILLKGALA